MSLTFRPAFSVEVACPSRQLLQRLYERLGDGRHQLRRTRAFSGGESAPRDHDHFVLTVADDQQRVWSPWLRVEVTPLGEGAHLAARFSPHPSVWTLFAFSYIGMSVILMISLCYSAALAMMGASPWTLAVSLATALVMLGMWVISQVGQRWSSDQMQELRDALERAIADCTPPPA